MTAHVTMSSFSQFNPMFTLVFFILILKASDSLREWIIQC